MRRLVCALLVVLVIGCAVPGADAAEDGTRYDARYDAPVDEPIIDVFRPPSTPYGPGNRGIDYGTLPGEQVHAANDGVVVFAGRVGLSLHVVVLHDDGVRTSYSFLSHVNVRRGDRVRKGDVVGLAGDELHFGARVGDDYIDPALLLAGAPPVVHLVPAHARRPASESVERKGLLRSLVTGTARMIHAGRSGVAWARDRTSAVASFGVDYVREQVAQLVLTAKLLGYYGNTGLLASDLFSAARAIHDDQAHCTPRSSAPRPPRRGRHVAILVGGFGSSSGHAAVLDVDTGALGYADGDVGQFSYRGGQAPGPRRLVGIPVHAYDTHDSEGDIRDAALALRDLLERIRLAYPGVPVDLIAHSQGGLVVRVALGDDLDHLDPRLPPVDHVITLGTPHGGADVADINASLGTHPVGQLAQAGVEQASGGHVDPWSPAADELSTISPFTTEIAQRPLPDGAHVTAIAASGDLVVPVPRAVLDGASNVVVPLVGLDAHDRLPGSAVAAREMRLALAGQAPTCSSIRDALLGTVIASVEHEVGGGISGGAVLLGYRR